MSLWHFFGLIGIVCTAYALAVARNSEAWLCERCRRPTPRCICKFA